MTVATMTASVCLAMKEHGDPTQDQPRSQWGENSAGMNQGMRVLSYLIGGVVLYGFSAGSAIATCTPDFCCQWASSAEPPWRSM